MEMERKREGEMERRSEGKMKKVDNENDERILCVDWVDELEEKEVKSENTTTKNETIIKCTSF